MVPIQRWWCRDSLETLSRGSPHLEEGSFCGNSVGSAVKGRQTVDSGDEESWQWMPPRSPEPAGAERVEDQTMLIEGVMDVVVERHKFVADRRILQAAAMFNATGLICEALIPKSMVRVRASSRSGRCSEP